MKEKTKKYRQRATQTRGSARDKTLSGPPSDRSKGIDAGKVHNGRSSILLLTVFFFSGLCGLMYEVVWTRLLVLVFGSTTHAIATVLAVFMLGLALGSHISGRLADRMANAQKAYGLIEIGIGLYAFLFLPFLHAAQSIHMVFFQHLYDKMVLLSIFRVFLSTLIIIIPTVLMGATIPIFARIFTRSAAFIGRDVGIIYFLNTIGATAGSFASAFALIPRYGLQWTLYIGGVLNILIGIATINARPLVSQLRHDDEEKQTAVSIETNREHFVAIWTFFMIGLLAMVYENAWSRALTMVFGTSIYAFSTMLTTYLFGLAVGSFIFGRFVDRISRPFLWYGILTSIVGLSVFVTTPLIGRLPDYFVSVFSDENADWGHVILIEFLISFLIMLLPTFSSGAIFPLVSRISFESRGRNISRSVANAYTMNTAGCILGSLATGFLLIPLLGVEKALLLAGAINLVIGAALLLHAAKRKRVITWVCAFSLLVIAAAGGWAVPTWNPKVMASGVYIYSTAIAKAHEAVDTFMEKYQLLFYREGPSETVSILESPSGARFLRVNGKTDGSDMADMYTQTLLGLLPIMVMQHPRNGLNIGLGTGITSGSMLDYPLDSLECVEISPAVVEAAEFFSRSNGDVLRSPKFHLHVLDGRTWLMSMDRQYDIIVSEPSHPWQTGNANLFTVEFFEAARKRLTDGGVLCQWLPYYHMDKEHFRLLIRSLKSVFKYANVWIANTDALVIASDKPTVLDLKSIEDKMNMQPLKNRFAGMGIHSPVDLLSFFYIDNDALQNYVAGMDDLNSDMNPIVEFNAPKYLTLTAKPNTFFELMGLSYNSKMVLANCNDPTEFSRARIHNRARYLREWHIPEPVIQEVTQKSLSALSMQTDK
jgi:spermidine synthase